MEGASKAFKGTMSQSLKIPVHLSAKTPQELSKKILMLQAQQGGRVQIISIYFANGEHIAWYYPLGHGGEGVM